MDEFTQGMSLDLRWDKTPQFFWKENKMDWICHHTQDASNKIKVYFEIPEPKRCSVSRHPSVDWHGVWV